MHPSLVETVEKLRSLGYVAYSAPAISTDEANLADPKDRLQVFKSILEAEDLAAAGHLARSDELLASLRTAEPKLYLIPFMMGENAAKEHRWADAESNLGECLKLNPGFDQAIMAVARATFAEGKLESSRTWLELAIHRNPQNFLAYHALGLVAQSEKRMDEAKRDFQKAVELKPDYAPAEQSLGMTSVESRQYEEALKPLEKAASLGDRDAVLFNYLGTAYLNTGSPAKAIESYRKALAAKNDYSAARLNLAFAYLKMGDRTHATNEFRSLCAQDRALCQQYERFFQ